MKYFLPLFSILSLMVATPFTSHAADATSFNPTLVQVTAKPISSIPVGTIISWPVPQNPADWQNPDGSYNWLECNGQTFSQTVYPELFAIFGGQIPDLRGLFLRGYGSQVYAQNNGSTVGVTSTTHSSGPLGQVQGDAMRTIHGELASNYNLQPIFEASAWNTNVSGAFGISNFSGACALDSNAQYSATMGFSFDSRKVAPTANEIRPANMAVRYLVRARP